MKSIFYKTYLTTKYNQGDLIDIFKFSYLISQHDCFKFFYQLDVKLLKIHIKSAGEEKRTRHVKETANHKMFIAM